MYSLLLSLGAGVLTALALRFGTAFGWMAAVFPGLLVTAVVFVAAGFRVRKQMEAVVEVVQKEAAARHLDKAIQALQAGFRLAPWQFFVGAQLHAQIGMLRYWGGSFEEALPDLEAALPRTWLARLLYRDPLSRSFLAAARYRKRDVSGALTLLEETVQVAEKDGMAWSMYAWMLEKEGRHDDAIRVLGRATAVLPKDEKLKDSLQSLQNGKKLKLWKLYDMTWFQFGLEKPPGQTDPTAGRARRQLFNR